MQLHKSNDGLCRFSQQNVALQTAASQRGITPAPSVSMPMWGSAGYGPNCGPASARFDTPSGSASVPAAPQACSGSHASLRDVGVGCCKPMTPDAQGVPAELERKYPRLRRSSARDALSGEACPYKYTGSAGSRPSSAPAAHGTSACYLYTAVGPLGHTARQCFMQQASAWPTLTYLPCSHTCLCKRMWGGFAQWMT